MKLKSAAALVGLLIVPLAATPTAAADIDPIVLFGRLLYTNADPCHMIFDVEVCQPPTCQALATFTIVPTTNESVVVHSVLVYDPREGLLCGPVGTSVSSGSGNEERGWTTQAVPSPPFMVNYTFTPSGPGHYFFRAEVVTGSTYTGDLSVVV